MEELKTIKLLGAAGRKFGRSFQLAVKSPAEALRALMAIIPEFKGWVLEQHVAGIAWRVVTDDSNGLKEDELERETGREVIVFAPVLQGAGGGGIGQIILGVALIAVAVFVPAATFGLTSMLAVGLLGGGLVLSGVASMLTPTPRLNGPDAKGGTEAALTSDLESNLFSRNQGTGGQGECVPLLYGRRRVDDPRVISFDLRNLAQQRDIDVSGTAGLLGYVNSVEL